LFFVLKTEYNRRTNEEQTAFKKLRHEGAARVGDERGKGGAREEYRWDKGGEKKRWRWRGEDFLWFLWGKR